MPIKISKVVDEFEAAFRSAWKTAKKRRISKIDVEDEIAAYRKETSK